MKYYIIAGEASGDLHGSNLMHELAAQDSSAEFRFWGGDKMAEVGGAENLVMHYKKASFMGFWEVLKNLRTIFGQIDRCKADLVDYQPDVVILIDYPGFNFRIAKFAKQRGIKVFYYISPKVWAWKESRVKRLKADVDKLFIIFPFEIEYFKRWGIDAFYGGNPLVDAVAVRNKTKGDFGAFCTANDLNIKPVVALLSGSRKHEIDWNLPTMVEVSKAMPEYQFVVAGVSWLDRPIYEKHLAGSEVKYLCDKTYELLSHASGAIVTSGTATLETALFGVPEIVCFRGPWISMLIAKMFIKVKYVSLVNLIMDREVVVELLQMAMTEANATRELKAVLPHGEHHAAIMDDYAELNKLVGGEGASARVAAEMIRILEGRR